ncbi:MAG: sensor histidine kinase [Coleofasciculaceae cyanobacterium SM2_1_6]|nr:sensor histidine kinase [Coleofasciculaceae cyanobacterium SM2_1_6]
MELERLEIPDTPDTLIRVQQLEKENRILKKKLERSEKTCLELEQTNQRKEALLRKIIQELEDSQKEVEEKRQLEITLGELKQTQSQLINAEKMSSLGQLVAGVAHEINNPVNFIHGNISHIQNYSQSLLELIHLYQQYYPNPALTIQEKAEEIDLEFLQSDLLKVLGSMKLGTDRIRQIVLSLRNFSRMDESDFKPVDIHEGLDSTLLILQHRLKSKSSEIQVVRHYGNLPKIECYPGQLNQVFMNILSNALDAIEEQNNTLPAQGKNHNLGAITISTSVISLDNTDWAEIAIADNGLGIPEAIREKIFNPFFTTKPIGKGTGMGMAISYQIITKKHNGNLICTSTPGIGTQFVVRIPVHQSACRL